MTGRLGAEINPFIVSRKIGLANPREKRQPVLN